MPIPTLSPHSTSRAQSETVGVVLLVGVFAIAAITIGVAVIGSVTDDAESQPRADLNVSVTPDNVTITHGGGDAVDVADVAVVVRGDGGESRYELVTFDQRQGSTDDRFDPGDRYRLDHDQGTGEVRITVVHTESNSVLADVTRTVRPPQSPDPPLTNAEPRPQFTATPDVVTPGETFSVDASASTDPDGTVDRYDWDWTDDGSYEDSGETTSHSYGSTGEYTVRLRVIDNGSAVNTTTRTVTVGERPTASFTTDPDDPGSAETITFDASGSSDEASITDYEWDWTSDGTYEGSGETATHSYGSPGEYDVTLRVTDETNLTETTTQTVTANDDPVAAFTASCADDDCSFDASGSSDDGSIASYTWAFGDGNTTTTATSTVDHSYDTTGEYDVTLTVTDDLGATNATTRTVDSNTPPTARFGVDCSGRECEFDASNATDDGSITTYQWAFGDGDTATTGDAVLTRTYDSGGEYDVTLTVTDGAGESDSRVKTVTVEGLPTASINVSSPSSTPRPGENITLDGTKSSDPDGSITSYEWDTNGTGTYDTTGATATTSYASPGDYSVTLRVTDDDGNAVTSTQTVTVETNRSGTVSILDDIDENTVSVDVETSNFENMTTGYLVVRNSDTGDEQTYEVTEETTTVVGLPLDEGDTVVAELYVSADRNVLLDDESQTVDGTGGGGGGGGGGGPGFTPLTLGVTLLLIALWSRYRGESEG